ncbi:unnamed protein product [Colletotrichum noveboracense]|uniref:Uncharacterized protein n=1 Tax=Colletotrichum noveboracense TaxID=2664923 RepID=A0A9W4S488_9PEZI|nr:unnamed protein product [Colletotrichum noveboracense]
MPWRKPDVCRRTEKITAPEFESQPKFGPINFEGVQYISSLSNTRDDYLAEFVFKPIATQAVDSVYVAQNYLGVMKVLFCSSGQALSVEQRRGLWWRIIPLHRCEPVLVTETDGIKLCALVPAKEETGSHPNPFLWSVPPSEPVRLVQLAEGSPPAAQLSMRIRFFWKFSIISLHAHISGEDLAFYEGYEAGIWLYFPLEKGEKITEIWKHGESKADLALIFKTNHDRVALFGPQLKSQALPLSALIDLPRQNGGSRLFFEHSPHGVRSLCFETPKPEPRPGSSLALQKPESPYPKSFSESYFYSTAILDGIDMITLCQRYVWGKRRIIGLLLQFSGGRQSCVGQIRLDCLGNPLPLGSHQSIWLGFSKDDHRPFVSVLEFSEPKPTEGVWWFEVELFGRLEWWFSLKQSQVCHMGKSSPPTRL